MNDGRDIHSFSEPARVRVDHCSLHLEVSFENRSLIGTAGLRITRFDPEAPLVLDTRDLEIHEVYCGNRPAGFELGDVHPVLGAPLTIHLTRNAHSVLIRYSTRPQASGLQWLTPQQTAGKNSPFLYSQNQSIHARSWIPIQDSPGVRMTYNARVKAVAGMTVLMSAEQVGSEGGAHAFKMDLPIPPYLIALAVGDLEFSVVGPRTGVWAEPSILVSARREFSDTEQLLETVEKLYGTYLWGRYDLLILPAGFPFGGMENPRLTFVTPTVIAGDKSLISLVSHELAHSWSGNLVTNATWSDFWLNEGFTTYIENRIQEEVYGREQALMEQVLDAREIEKELAEFATRDQILHIDLRDRDPDEGTTRIPYIKGALLLRQIEQVFGRAVFDSFLNSYFQRFAFQSVTTAEALDYIQRELFYRYPDQAKQIPLEDWIYEPGLPNCAPKATSKRLETVASMARDWQAGRIAAAEIPTAQWNTQEWLEFLQVLPRPLTEEQMAQLDHAFHLTQIGNSEILDEWLLMAVQSRYTEAYSRLEEFLLQVGRIRYIKPLYVELMKTSEGQARAREIYAKARPGYHPIAQTALDKIVNQ